MPLGKNPPDASLRPMTPGDRVAQEVEVVVTETEKSDESRSLPVVTSAGKAVEFGAMVAGQPEVAVAVHAAREELEQRAPHEKPPEETTLRGYLQGARE